MPIWSDSSQTTTIARKIEDGRGLGLVVDLEWGTLTAARCIRTVRSWFQFISRIVRIWFNPIGRYYRPEPLCSWAELSQTPENHQVRPLTTSSHLIQNALVASTERLHGLRAKKVLDKSGNCNYIGYRRLA